jgi:hypothetical protein
MARASHIAWRLVPTGGTHDTSREWFFRRKVHKTPGYPGVLIKKKRMKGFEPSTFAMATPERVAEASRYGRSECL